MPLVTTTSGALTEPLPSPVGVVETVAAAGSVIANAAAIGANTAIVNVTGADDTKGVVLPATVPGKEVKVYSATATNGLKLYPPVNSAINGGTANAAVVMEGKTGAICFATNATNWCVLFTANS